jgi:filamentous hemagglutinin family protein
MGDRQVNQPINQSPLPGRSLSRLAVFCWSVSLAWSGITPQPVQAQISADRSLPQNSIIQTAGDTFNITGGSVSGTNLFHSFNEFSLNAGQTAHFQNAATIEQILTRVTGNNVSQIDGLIRANGNANLFLLNPNGILFGENARLDIGGSFIATSADAIEFADGNLFAAQDIGSSALLTMTVPVGLQFNRSINGNPENGAIALQGNGHNFTRADPIFAPVEGLGILENGLKVLPGHNLALIGNGINIDGGLLSAAAANIELGSIAIGKVSFSPGRLGWDFQYAPLPNSLPSTNDLSFSDINLSNRAAIDGSGSFTSKIQLTGQNLTITDGSIIAAQNQGLSTGSNITVNAIGDVVLDGTTADAIIQSGIANTTLAPGQAGSIVIKAENLSVLDGARIVSRTFSNARGGDLDINVNQDLRLIGFSAIDPRVFSNIASTTLATGRSGDIRINTQHLFAKDSGIISSSTFNTGKGGNVFVTAAESIKLAGAEPLTTTPASITASTFREGQAGSVVVNTKHLMIEHGGLLDSSTGANGNAGSVTVNASESVILSGELNQPGSPGQIASASALLDPAFQAAFGLPPVPTGNSGNITINTKLLQATNGGLVSVVSNDLGNPGTVQINSDRIVLADRGGIFALTDVGSGGNIEITTGDLAVASAFINASSIGTGDGGDIQIDATGTIDISDIGFVEVLNLIGVPLLAGGIEAIDIQGLNGILSLAGLPVELAILIFKRIN